MNKRKILKNRKPSSQSRSKGPKKSGSSGGSQRRRKPAGPRGKPPFRGKRAAPKPAIVDSKPKRLNQFIARSGVCSRRDADELIRAGKIRVNGKVVTDFSYKVQAEDVVKFGNKELSTPAHIYILLNKPRNVITTVSDEKERETVMDLLDAKLEGKGLFPVGRLDRNTVGALLITNDGILAERLMHPRYNVKKIYLATSKLGLEDSEIEQFTKGIVSQKEELKVDDVAFMDSKNKEIGILMHHGKNRHIRRMFEALGHDVAKLERVEYAGLSLKGIRRGKWRNLTVKEINSLRHLVSIK